MATTKRRGWTLLIIPGSESSTRQFRLPRAAVFLFTGGLVLLILYAVVETVLFWEVARRAADADRLRIRVRELESSSSELLRLGNELTKLQAFEERVRRVLGSTGETSPELPLTSEDLSLLAPSGGVSKIFSGMPTNSTGLPSYSAMDIPTLTPVRGFVTRGFYSVGDLHSSSHYGVDLAGKEGTPVLAAAAGLVVSAGWDYRFGNVIALLHRSGYVTFYGHNQLVLVKPGDHVRQGEPIALLGNSGVSTAPHLHFEVWQDGTPVDPSSLIRNIP